MFSNRCRVFTVRTFCFPSGHRAGYNNRHGYCHPIVPKTVTPATWGFSMPVLLIGTLDTKGVEIQFLRDLLNQAGVTTTVMDAGVLGPPRFPPDIPREEVFAAAGTSLDAVQRAGDRGQA